MTRAHDIRSELLTIPSLAAALLVAYLVPPPVRLTAWAGVSLVAQTLWVLRLRRRAEVVAQECAAWSASVGASAGVPPPVLTPPPEPVSRWRGLWYAIGWPLNGLIVWGVEDPSVCLGLFLASCLSQLAVMHRLDQAAMRATRLGITRGLQSTVRLGHHTPPSLTRHSANGHTPPAPHDLRDRSVGAPLERDE